MLTPKYNLGIIDPDQCLISNFQEIDMTYIVCPIHFLEIFYLKILSIKRFSSRFCFAVSNLHLHFRMVKVA